MHLFKKSENKNYFHLPFSFLNLYNRRIIFLYYNYIFVSFFFCSGFLSIKINNSHSDSQITFTNHRESGTGEGHSRFSLSFSPASKSHKH